jgi:hypothetical protein
VGMAGRRGRRWGLRGGGGNGILSRLPERQRQPRPYNLLLPVHNDFPISFDIP